MKRATKRKQRTGCNQKGTVAVEMAIAVTLLATLLLGVMEVGSIVHDYQVLQNAAREGARFSANPANQIIRSQDPAVLQTIQDRVVAYLQNENITVAEGDVVVDQAYPIQVGSLTVPGSHVTVTYSRSLIFPGVTSFIPSLGTLQLTGSAVFRNFYAND
jgi:Flp pilus assembly protein TadG